MSVPTPTRLSFFSFGMGFAITGFFQNQTTTLNNTPCFHSYLVSYHTIFTHLFKHTQMKMTFNIKKVLACGLQ